MATRVLQESAQRVSDGVTELLRKQPFFGSLALRLPLRADPSRETLASDGHEIRYSPRWVAATDAHVIETAMARVVMACALKHHTRRGERDPERWQLASQLVTHALIRDAGFTLPPDAEAWDGVSVEEAYDRLPEPQEDDSCGDGESPPAGGAMAAAAAGQPSTASDNDGDSSDGTADTPDSPANDDDSGKPDDKGGQEQDGSADDARGDDRQDEGQPGGDGQGPDGHSDAPASHDPSGTGEIMDAGARGDGGDGEGESPVDVTAEEQTWDEAMHQAMNLARAEGKLPGGVEETVRNAHASTLDWRSLLRRYMTDAARRDYSWSLPNRRFIDSGLYLPSIRSEGMDAIAVIIDTSGSLPAQTLADFWAELREVATEIQPESVHVLQVDAAVQDAAEYAPDDLPYEIALKGRGGTDFRPGFEWLDEHGIQPGVCLYFTDMLCSDYPEAEPGFPTIWVNHSSAPSEWNREPWGERIDIGPDRRGSP
ncbi:MAG: VWA-like domain-containing protein [Defluviicoccus sp.]|nr:VWA-like domain-containing protein [Defluviicoccus sp.]